jgi:catechol 2,3-dioxygenase-like lactoylglutathione lyase family enzyme
VKLEHVALLVADPAAAARWYEEHLGMRIVRSGQAPESARFLADSNGTSVLEIYAGPSAPPEYASMDPSLLHVAFSADDVPGTRARLIAAGATPVGDAVLTPGGDQFAMLRDPWGLALQLARRARPLVPAAASGGARP